MKSILLLLFFAGPAFGAADLTQSVKDWYSSAPKLTRERIDEARSCGLDRPLGYFPSSGNLFIEDGEMVFFYAKSADGNELSYEGEDTEALGRQGLDYSTPNAAKLAFLRLAVEPSKNGLFLMAYGMSGLGMASGPAVWEKVKAMFEQDQNLDKATALDLAGELLKRSKGKYASIQRAMRTRLEVRGFAADTLKLSVIMDGQKVDLDLPCRESR